MSEGIRLGSDLDIVAWRRLIEATHHYQALGYQFFPAAWAVPEHIQRISYQGELCHLDVFRSFVGSAENSLVWFFSELQPGMRYYALTPCVRQNDAGRSPFHHPYFMKLELFAPAKTQGEALRLSQQMLQDAQAFMEAQGTSPLKTYTPEGYDLEVAGIEVGSYGARSFQLSDRSGIYACGTGLAEPRFSQALAQTPPRG